VTTEFSTLLKAYGVAKVVGDRYAGGGQAPDQPAVQPGAARGGRDLIDHPQHPGAHDDLANAVCGAFVILERDRRPQLISHADVVGTGGLPTPLPPSQYVFAAVWSAGTDIAVVYGASSVWSQKLFVADFSI
jgi:hypothetical protein